MSITNRLVALERSHTPPRCPTCGAAPEGDSPYDLNRLTVPELEELRALLGKATPDPEEESP